MDASREDSPTIVTASDRLARHLGERAADAAEAEGRLAWERPDILPVGAFWRRLAGELAFVAPALAEKRVLSTSAVLCRFEALIAETFSDNPLLQTAGAARSALDAWRLVRDWQLDERALAADPLAETRWLVEWGRRFEAECAAAGWLPEYALPDAVLAVLEQEKDAREHLPRRIRLAGFMDVAPRARDAWRAIEALGVDVAFDDNTGPPGKARRVALRDAREEALAVAAWARKRLEDHPRERLGVVVPDLAAHRAALSRALTEALAPARLLDVDTALSPVNFSLGLPLSDHALAADALAILSLSERDVTFATAARLCRSPYLGFERHQRLLLEGVMRRDGHARFSLRDWQRLAAREHLRTLSETLQRFEESVRGHGGKALPSAWARRFSDWLEDFGWCRGRALDSAEFQAREAWHGQLGRLAELDPVLREVPRGVALGWLNRYANETLFQPRAATAPVQVLGLLEATGVGFDAVWVMGMDDETLPASPRPNPFLPIELQREKGLPNASAAREHAFAQRLFDGLCRAAPEVTFSFARRKADAERRASPLLRALPESTADFKAVPAIAAEYFRERREETFVDDRGAPHAGGYVRGGTAVLQNQSHCAFRAFAVHRLGAGEWPTPASGPDAKVRGDIVHKVMEALWTRWRSRSGLERAIADEGFEAALRETVRDVVTRVANSTAHRWTQALRDIEVERLVKLLNRWLRAHELARPDFEVTEIEGRRADGSEVATVVRAGPLELRGKLDRIDRLPDGSELIIDYKTGEAPRKNDFFGERPAAPQLPAYLLARKQAKLPLPAGIAVASLKTGREGLQGVMRVADPKASTGIAGIENVAKTDAAASWEDAVSHWEQTIHALGEAFSAGEARVDPLRGVCDYCHLSLFCRIREQREFAEADADE